MKGYSGCLETESIRFQQPTTTYSATNTEAHTLPLMKLHSYLNLDKIDNYITVLLVRYAKYLVLTAMIVFKLLVIFYHAAWNASAD